VENAYTRGQDSYPSKLTRAYDMLVNFVNPKHGADTGEASGISFYQEKKPNGDQIENQMRDGIQGQGNGRCHHSNSRDSGYSNAFE
jgi:hypothetical protein